MSYFSMFPEVVYDSKGNDKYTLLKNTFRRVKLTGGAAKNIMEFDYYDVQDGETPEMIAYKYYGGAPPVETSIELQFKELEVITREMIAEGF